MKKVLFITYYWPPAGGAPMMRVLKLYQYLPEFGYEPIIVTTEGGDYPFVDESLQEVVRPDTPVYRTSGFSLHKMLKKLSPKAKKNFIPYGFTDDSGGSWIDRFSRWVKYNMIPDTRYPWRFGTVRKAIRIAKKHKVDLIFSSSPPQTNHIIARKVARKLKLPWVGDFRDPWTDVFWITSPQSLRLPLIQKLDRWLEKRTIADMHAITTVSPSLVELFLKKTNLPIYQIPNGFDHVYFEPLQRVPSSYFTVFYGGSMSKEQSPEPFFKAFKSLLEVNNSFSSKARMHFMGNFPPFLHQLVKAYELEDWVKWSPYAPMQESLQAMVNSDLLLLIVPKTPDNAGILTSKIFDYIGARRPILAIGPVEGDAAKVLQETRAGEMFDYEDTAAITDYLFNIFDKWQQKIDLTIPWQNVERYTRRNIASQFARVFDSVL